MNRTIKREKKMAKTNRKLTSEKAAIAIKDGAKGSEKYSRGKSNFSFHIEFLYVQTN